MIYVLFFLVLLLAGGYKFHKEGFHTKYLDPSYTAVIKGLFIAFVFCGHFSGYVKFDNPLDPPFYKVYWYMGQFVVAMFMLYSGYGIVVSIKNKGEAYVRKLPSHRILKTLFHFDVAVSLYMLIYISREGLPTVQKFVLAMLGWDGFGNSNWYIFTIVIMWTLVYLVFRLFRNQTIERKLCLCTVAIGLAAGVIFLHKPGYWCDTMIVFVLGMWLGLYRERVETFLFRSGNKIKGKLTGGQNWYWMAPCFIVATALLGKAKGLPHFHILFYEMWMVTFTIALLLVTMKFEFHSHILSWLGRNLFEVYILQRIPMILLQPYMVGHNYRYFVACAICTLALTVVFKKVVARLDTWIFKE